MYEEVRSYECKECKATFRTFDVIADEEKRLCISCKATRYDAIVRAAELQQEVETQEENLYKKVSDKLIELGFKPNLKGFDYIIEATLLYNCSVSITRDIYPVVAEKFKTVSTRVERGIRHSIQRAYEVGTINEVPMFINSISPNKTLLTNQEFVSLLKLHLEL